ncbi:hypothetical protein [Aestuariimicrobium sp. Y1814]|uniref:hypothetical protein n=1 Tax=Aestuariimicrobium sp. Y1814 TaxID=3418742 RepID=UPI003DA71F2D
METLIDIAMWLFILAVALFVYGAGAHKMAGEGRADVYGSRVITNSGGFVWWPRRKRSLDLAARPITTTAGPVPAADGSEVTVVMDADVLVGSDDDAIRTAAKHFAGAEDTIDPVAGELIEAAVAAVVAASSDDQLADRVDLAQRVVARANTSLAKLGLRLDWLTISSLTRGSDELIAR